MRTAKTIISLMAAIMVVTGCDWVRSQLGMATSQQLEAIRKEQERLEAERRINDSIEKIISDSLELTRKDTLKTPEQKGSSTAAPSRDESPAKVDTQNRYHVIVGSFKDYTNATRMVENLRKKGYSPSTMDFKNGFRVVSAAGYPNISTALTEMYKLIDQGFGTDDVWVYDTNHNLHIKNN